MTSTFAGDPQDELLEFLITENELGADVLLQARAGYGNRFWALIADGMTQQIVYLAEGDDPRKFSVAYDPDRTKHAITVVPLGDWGDTAGVDVSFVQQQFTDDKGLYLQLDWDASIETVEAYGDTAQLSSWSLAGLARFATGTPHNGRKTQVQMGLSLTSAGATKTITLYAGQVPVASGSRSGSGSITLSELNSSGVSGSVTLTYSADIALSAGAYIVGRWAASYSIVAGTKSATILDTGLANRLSARLGPFAAGGPYAYSITPVSDTGISGSSATGTFLIPGRPNPPGTPVYVSGHSGTAPNGTATSIQFTASNTVGATYRVYDSALDEPTDLDTPVATVAAGVGPFTVTLPVIDNGTGKRRIIVVAVAGGIEDGQRKQVTLEYVDGVYQAKRPNNPGYNFNGISAGRTLSIAYVYDATDEVGICNRLRLDLEAEDGTVIEGTAIAIQPKVNGTSMGLLTETAPADGWYSYRVRALTAENGISANTEFSEPEWFSDVVPSAPANVVPAVIA